MLIGGLTMDIIEKIKKLADSTEEANNKTLFHSDNGFKVSSPKVTGIFSEIVLDDDKLLFFADTPFARIILQNEWDTITIS